MPTTLLRISCLLALAAGPAVAQNSDIGLLAGVFVPAGSVSGGNVSGSVSGGGALSYAVQLHETAAGSLYLEFPLFISGTLAGSVTPGVVAASSRNVYYFTPGVRWKFTPAARVAFYVAGGAGMVLVSRQQSLVSGSIATTTSGVGITPGFDFGGGVDLRLSRLVSLRAEGRDAISAGTVAGSHNHGMFLFGAGLHF